MTTPPPPTDDRAPWFSTAQICIGVAFAPALAMVWFPLALLAMAPFHDNSALPLWWTVLALPVIGAWLGALIGGTVEGRSLGLGLGLGWLGVMAGLAWISTRLAGSA